MLPLLLSLALATSGDAAAAPAATAHLHVVSGTVTLFRAGDERVETRTRRTSPAKLEGTTHLEQGSRTTSSVRWRGVGSARVAGRSSFEVAHEGARPVLRLRYVGEATVEARRGGLVLELPGGWSGSLERAAIHVRELPAGELLVTHPGGRKLVLTRGSERRTLQPGERLRLPLALSDDAG